MECFGHVSRGHAEGAMRRLRARLAALAVVLLSGWPAGEAAAQPGGLFSAASASAAEVDATRIDPDLLTLRRRLVTIDLGQLAPVTDTAARGAAAGIEIAPSGVLTLNLFDDAVFSGLVERVGSTFSGGYSLSGSLAGVELGTMTLVVNGDVVAGTVRTLQATYRIRPAGNGLHAVSQVDLSRLPPLGEPIPDPRRRRDRSQSGSDPDVPPPPR